MKTFVSVVIPVLNDAARLKVCLEALGRQTYPADAFEVIVVDNGSTDETKKNVESFLSHRSPVTGHQTEQVTWCLGVLVSLLAEPIRGLHQARNTGIKAAKGEALAFTDADCIPAHDWIEKGVAALLRAPDKSVIPECFNRESMPWIPASAGMTGVLLGDLSKPNIGLVGGRVDIFFKDPAKPTTAELFEKMTAFRQKEYIEKMRFAAPANVFTFRSVIEKVGLFDGTLKSGADVEWGNRVFAAGYAQVYADDAVVSHPARRTLGELLRKHRRVIGGLYDIRRKNGYTFRKFLIDLKDDWPKWTDVFSLMRQAGLGRVRKIGFFLILVAVKVTRLAEAVRLRLGGKSGW